MRSKTLLQVLGIALFLAIAIASDAAAQSGTAELRIVDSGTVEADRTWRYEEMCLDGGSYIFAFELGSNHDSGTAILLTDPGEEIVRSIVINRTDELHQRWSSFFSTRGCFLIRVVGGHTAVFQLRVGVSW